MAMKFTQIAAGDDALYALGEDGKVYRLSWEESPTGKDTYDEYGCKVPIMKRSYLWKPVIAEANS